jgi:hypothetical protein
MLLLCVGWRNELRVIWNDVSNAVPKLLSGEEANLKNLKYLDISNFHGFKLKICTR